jgi:hypothetical protein
MAVYLSDVLRAESGETGLYFALRNKQSGFSTDTFKMIHKYEDGTIKKFPSEDVLSLYGATGIAGRPGDTGIEGSPGLTGAQGYTGAQGITGLQGAGGSGGTQGDTGAQGLTGAQGYTGAQGIQGIQGTPGTQGIQGIQGATGIQGIQGSQGATGAQGIQGIQGIQGATGSQGVTGATFVSSNMRITDEGALQIKMINDSGAYLQPNYFVSLKTDNYENGVDVDALNFEQTIGIVSTGGSTGMDVWVTVKGPCNLNFDSDYVPSAGDNFGISLGEDGPWFAQQLLSSTKALGIVMSGATGALNMCKVLYNGPDIGQLQGYVDLPVVGYSGNWATATVVKDGSFVTLHMSGFQPGTDTSGSFGFELPSFIRPANIARTLPISCNGTFYNAGSVMYNHFVHGEFESTFNYLYLKHYDNTGTDVGWTGSCGWYGYMTIGYNLLPGI